MLPIKETKDGVIFNIRVVPRSSRCEVAGIQEDALKLKITAPPVEGKANEECIKFLADKLGVRKSRVTIIAGHKSKRKTIAVSGLKSSEFKVLSSKFKVQIETQNPEP
ncbi:MAG: YggU family protein [Proteobacteria bacterium]|nr:YggU family protein [Pseudomonadota bacterium]